MLIDPVHGMEGVKNGLLLWYDRILPALLPFSIISYILVASDNLSFFSKDPASCDQKLIPVSPDGVYPLLAGFLFGFPLGSKIIGQLSENGQLRPSEATDFALGLQQHQSGLYYRLYGTPVYRM